MIRNRIGKLIEELGVTAYRFAEDTQIPKNTLYPLKNMPERCPNPEIINKIMNTYKEVKLDQILEHIPD